MDNLWYLALAYVVIWLGLFAYLVNLAREGRAIRQEIELLRGLIDSGETEADTEAPAFYERQQPRPEPSPAAPAGQGWPLAER